MENLDILLLEPPKFIYGEWVRSEIQFGTIGIEDPSILKNHPQKEKYSFCLTKDDWTMLDPNGDLRIGQIAIKFLPQTPLPSPKKR